jgi:hypothetical protein
MPQLHFGIVSPSVLIVCCASSAGFKHNRAMLRLCLAGNWLAGGSQLPPKKVSRSKSVAAKAVRRVVLWSRHIHNRQADKPKQRTDCSLRRLHAPHEGAKVTYHLLAFSQPPTQEHTRPPCEQHQSEQLKVVSRRAQKHQPLP